jgi:hypothetical protein
MDSMWKADWTTDEHPCLSLWRNSSCCGTLGDVGVHVLSPPR